MKTENKIKFTQKIAKQLAQKQFSLKAKQLEWVEYESFRGRKSYFAETPFTPYEVSDGGGYYVMFSPGKGLKFKSADEAKSAAQRDFEARIKECLIIE